jgi:three-Cys-motif partner protein
MPVHEFGGDWTTDKLERVRKYLVAYATIMRKQKFRFAYVDAFAGTGYRTLEQDEKPRELLFPEFIEKDSKQFVEGSARIALQVLPRFDKYVFIEKDPQRFAELQSLKAEFPAVSDDIVLVNAEANAYLQDVCVNRKWQKHRAVMFLDPFGMQVTWDTLVAIADTKAIDLWILFPVGVAVNRLLTRDGKIQPSWQKRLDSLFGESDWHEVFYRTKTDAGLFGDQVITEKLGSFDLIGQYFVKRLKTAFAGVAENPLPLLNSRNVPLFLLCFAAGNPKGAPTAIKIAQNILGKKHG